MCAFQRILSANNWVAVIVDDVASETENRGVLAAAVEGPTPADAVTAVDARSLTGKNKATSRSEIAVVEEFAPGVVGDVGGDETPGTANRRAPSDGAVEAGEGFEDAQLFGQIEFDTTPSFRHCHSEDAGLLHRVNDRWSQASSTFDLISLLANQGTHRERSAAYITHGLVCDHHVLLRVQ